MTEENQETNNKESTEVVEKPKLPKELKRISDTKIKGRIIIFNPENSEFAKNLDIKEPGDYVEKK